MNNSLIELSVVIPCLNEEDTIEICIKKILKIFNFHKIKGEIIVVDNGCTDNSINICKNYPVVVTQENIKGYGAALKKGIKNSSGKYILMADADNSYDFLEIPKFLLKLRESYDLVQGCRFPSGGGEIKKNAMPFSHRYFGNPFFSFLVRKLYNAPFQDVYCGMRAFKKSSFDKNIPHSNGMEFAIEHLLKFNGKQLKIAEVPITLYKDGRKNTSSHLKTVSDGLKTLKLLLICCPRWVYLMPSLIFFILGFHNILIIDFEKFNELKILKEITISSIFFILSMQILILGIYSMTKAVSLGFETENISFLNNIYKVFNLKRILLVSITGIFFSIYQIYSSSYIFYSKEINTIIFYFIFCFFSILIFNSFFVSFLEFDENE